jgi:ferric-dicitrate binding protein FerR (iron transport regulator)
MAYLLWPTEEPVGTGPSARKGAGPVAQSDSRVGLVSACQGQVERKDGVDAVPVGLKPGQDLARGQEIHTAPDSYAVLDLTGGPVIRLEAESVLRIGPPERPACVLLLRGRGRFEVIKRDTPWRVETPNATVETHESVFFVSVHE